MTVDFLVSPVQASSVFKDWNSIEKPSYKFVLLFYAIGLNKASPYATNLLFVSTAKAEPD